MVTEYYVPALAALGWERDALVVDSSRRAIERVHALDLAVAAEAVTFEMALEEARIGDRFDAAIVALPNALHEEATALALRKGLHVLCEKPLATSADACQRLAQVAAEAVRTLAVGMVRRLLPSFEILQDALSEQLIGDLVRVDVEDGEPYAWTSESGAFFRPENGGVLADMGVHYLDWLEEVAGALTPVHYTDDWRGGVEANACFELRAASGLPVRLVLSRTRRLRNSLVVRGTRGELRLRKDGFDRCVWWSSETGRTTDLVGGNADSATLEAAFARQLVEFVASVRGDATPRVSAERAGRTMRLIDWAYAQRAPTKTSTQAEASGSELSTGRVFVTGGTGFIGSHLIDRLADSASAEIVAAVRNYRTCAHIARYSIMMPRVDLLDARAVREAVRGARFVFHLAYGRDGADAKRVTINGTRNVVEAAIAERCEAVVVLSTMYVFGRPNARVDESCRYAPVGGAYGRTKAAMERWCLARAASSPRTRIVVLNPACVYGPRGGAYTELPARMTCDAAFCLIDGGVGTANFTYVDNVVDAMLAAARCEAAHGQRFIISDGSTSWREFLGALLGVRARTLPSFTEYELRELHRRRKRPGLRVIARHIVASPEVRQAVRESRLGGAGIRIAERVAPRLMGRVRAQPARPEERPEDHVGALPPMWLLELFGPATTTLDSSKAQRVLGWTPRVGLGDGMKRTREWLEESGVIAGCL